MTINEAYAAIVQLIEHNMDQGMKLEQAIKKIEREMDITESAIALSLSNVREKHMAR